jgi:predicted MPP superfamily phosphohydrolase
MSALHWAFLATVVVTTLGVPLYAWVVRGRAYAVFALVIVGLAVPGAVAMDVRLATWLPDAAAVAMRVVFLYGMAAAGMHLAALVRPRLRSWGFRLGVSIPGMAFVAAGFLCGLWLLTMSPLRLVLASAGWTSALAVLRWLDLLPLAVAAISVPTSVRLVEEVVRVPLAADGPPTVSRLPAARYRGRARPPADARTLRLVQIADPHLGPWQPVAKLARTLERLLARAPDLVLLTGDFLTMEGSGTPGALTQALAPLRRFPERCFAIYGNHDHGVADEVAASLAANGVRLLVDDEALVETALGAVQIIGADYVGRGRRAHLQTLLARFPRRDAHLRLLLLHDPRGFRHVPLGDVDLTLSGHTHGGQLGLVSLGLPWTILTRSAWPDHGLFGHGSNRLYVHRGTGFYGFPLRIGVPGEASVLEVVRDGISPRRA